MQALPATPPISQYAVLFRLAANIDFQGGCLLPSVACCATIFTFVVDLLVILVNKLSQLTDVYPR